MLPLVDREVAGARFVVVASDRNDGDVHPTHTSFDELERRQRAVTGNRWWMVDQHHGTDLIELTPGAEPTTALAGHADGLVADETGQHVAIWAADCAPILLATESGRIIGVHAGWRGLAAGIVDRAIDAARGEAIDVAVLGPVIHPCCYEFAEADLDVVADGIGVEIGDVRGTTTDGHRALDVPSAVSIALGRHGVALDVVGPCTGCDERWFSHRVRNDLGRHAVVAWFEEAA